MLPARVASVPFTITDTKGRVVYRGVSRDDVGAWNSGYKAVYLLSFSGLRRCGTYQVRVGSTVSVTFKIANGTALYGPLVDNAVRYFTSERDGADVEHDVLGQEPANLTDEKASVYAARATTTTTTCSARSRRSAARSTCPAAGSTHAAAGTRSSATPPATRTR